MLAASGAVQFPNGLSAATLGGDAVTQCASDATPGRVLKLAEDGRRAFRLGSTAANSPPQITDFTVKLIPGFYRYAEATATGAPLPGTGQPGALSGYALVLRAGSGHPGVIAWRAATDVADQRIWFGARTAATGPMIWTALWHQRDVLGVVAQSGGRPTGAILQHGSTANGQFERRASGWMDCIRSNLSVENVTNLAVSLCSSADVIWTFPATFRPGEVPVVSISSTIGVTVTALSATSVTFRLIAHSTISGEVSIWATAKGRWSDMT